MRRETVNHWEKDKKVPSGENLVALARALEVTPDWILGGEPGHLLVNEDGSMEPGSTPGENAGPAEQMLHYLEMRVGIPKLASELIMRDLISAAYTLAMEERFAPEEFRKLDAWRDAILEEGRA